MLTMLGSPKRCCDGAHAPRSLAGRWARLARCRLSITAVVGRRGRTCRAGPARPRASSCSTCWAGPPLRTWWTSNPARRPDARRVPPDRHQCARHSDLRALAAPGAVDAQDRHCPFAQPQGRLPQHAAQLHRPGGRAGDNIVTRDTYPPSMGSVCEYLRRGDRDLPDYVYMPCYLGWGQAIRRPGPYAGFLGQRYDPLYTECVPYARPGAAPGARASPGTSAASRAARQRLWGQG